MKDYEGGRGEAIHPHRLAKGNGSVLRELLLLFVRKISEGVVVEVRRESQVLITLKDFDFLHR